ncbi:MAG: DUF4838 domain-containing protein, partial [Candidatus Omnitrophica bacterium]|nr:DUF4838 domain-containing protein [Candidatus Omnitrophota bacterium]
KYLEKISGTKIEIIPDDANFTDNIICVGKSRATENIKGLTIPSGLTSERNEEGYTIFCKGNILVLAGNDEGPYMGTYYAVAEFLKMLGVRWVLPGDFGEIVPQKTDVEIGELNIVDRPAFRVRSWWCNEPPDMAPVHAIWKLRNKMSIYDRDIICIPGDGWLRRYLPDPKLKDTRPELFGKNFDGSVNPYMANLTNPETIKIVADKIIQEFKKSEEKGNRINSIGFAPDDGLPMDHNPETMKINQGFYDVFGREGVVTELSISEEWFNFVNRVAEEVVKVYPDAIITTNGYANRSLPPEGIQLHPNLGVMAAFIWADTLKPVTSPKSWQGQVMGQQLKKWCQLCKRVFIYEYNETMLVSGLTPVPQIKKMAINYPLFKKWGMIGFINETRLPYFEEGIATRYIRAQLMWNPDADIESLIDDFYSRWYGPAAKYTRNFWESIEDCLLETPLLGHEDRILPFVYTETLIEKLEKYIAEAEKIATVEPFKTRVYVDRLTLEHLKAYMAMKDAEFNAKWADAVKYADKMVECRLALNKISPFLAMPPALVGRERYYSGDSYFGVLKRKTLYQKLDGLTNGETGILVALAPKKTRFSLDPHGLGKHFSWYAPDYKRDGWRFIDTTMPFYAQGYMSSDGMPYLGKMWYVFELDVPKQFSGKKVMLYAPFVTCEAWVWVNGRYAGHRKYLEAYISPAEINMDVTDFINFGTKNTIAVWVSTGLSPAQAADGFLGRLFLYSPVKQ